VCEFSRTINFRYLLAPCNFARRRSKDPYISVKCRGESLRGRFSFGRGSFHRLADRTLHSYRVENVVNHWSLSRQVTKITRNKSISNRYACNLHLDSVLERRMRALNKVYLNKYPSGDLIFDEILYLKIVIFHRK